jgi:hypothetical protein
MTDYRSNGDPLFDTSGAAEYLKSSIPTLERWRRVGEGPDFSKMCGLVRYRKSALDRFIDASTRQPRNTAAARRGGLPPVRNTLGAI